MSEDEEYLDRRAVSGSGTGLFVGLLLCAVLLGGLGAIVATVRTHNLIAIIVVVVAVLVAASRLTPLIVAPLAKGTVRLSSRGILTSGPLMQLQVDWAEIVAIDVLRRGRGRSVSVLLRDGNRRELAAPREQGSGRSAEFDEQVAKVVRWWEAHRPADFVPPDSAGAVRRRRYRRSGAPRSGAPRSARRVVRPRPMLTRTRGTIEDASATEPAVTEPPAGVTEPPAAEPPTAAAATPSRPRPSRPRPHPPSHPWPPLPRPRWPPNRPRSSSRWSSSARGGAGGAAEVRLRAHPGDVPAPGQHGDDRGEYQQRDHRGDEVLPGLAALFHRACQLTGRGW